MNVLKHPAVKISAFALMAYAAASFFQRKVMPIPVVGEYLPK